MGFLETVAAEKRKRLAQLKKFRPRRQLEEMVGATVKRHFGQSFRQRFPGNTRIIAEIKKASPSRGPIRPDMDILIQTGLYEQGGAGALSVITEERHFCGSLHDLKHIRGATTLPVLRKDFLVDEYELFESKAAGTDAVLLITEMLSRSQIVDYLHIAYGLDLDVLLEVHSMKAYEKVASLQGYLLGVNNRNLETLVVDPAAAISVVENLPDDLPVIIESGIETRADIERYRDYGVSGFLVGTSLVLADNPLQLLRVLRGLS